MKEIFEEITDQCLCGSGKAYVGCCKGKINPNENESVHKMFMADLDRTRREYSKICLHPNQDKCSSTKTHAHSISQKSVLRLIAENGTVLMPIVYGITNELQMKDMGIEAKATKFYCFCSEHDGMFYDIDKQDIELNKYTFFLYAYRSFAATYYKVIRELGCYTKLSAKYDYNFNPAAILFNMQMRNSMPALEWCNNKFNNAILENKYNCLENVHITLDYKVYFAVSTCFPLMFDILGNKINHAEYDLPMVYISVIPQEHQTQIIFSWFMEDCSLYSFFKEQLEILPIRFVLKYLNNLFPLNCENITIGPALWREWGESVQKDFLILVEEHMKNETIKNYSCSYFKSRDYNLFKRM